MVLKKLIRVINGYMFSYGDKFKGSIKASESVITKENGFDVIVEGEGTPYHNINLMHEQWKKENGYV